MEDRFYNKENGLWYELQGDYYLPCLKLPEQKEFHIGIWGQRRKNYLYENRKALYTTLLTSCKLCSHLEDIDERAEKMYWELIDKMSEQEGLTEDLKAKDMMEWVRRRENIENKAREMVFEEVIYNDSLFIPSGNKAKKPPKIFWKYFDSYRRNTISLFQFSKYTGLPCSTLELFLKQVNE